MKKHAKHLKMYRVENSFTQKELSSQLGISQAYISAIEKGKVPTDKIKKKISKLLKKPIADIFFLNILTFCDVKKPFKHPTTKSDYLKGLREVLGKSTYFHYTTRKEISKMDNKELYINSLCFTVVFFPLVTALIYIAALLMDNIFN